MKKKDIGQNCLFFVERHIVYTVVNIESEEPKEDKIAMLSQLLFC